MNNFFLNESQLFAIIALILILGGIEMPAKKKETKIICFANNKGGSGKSTTCANLGFALSKMGKNVLLIDGDMQTNLSLSFFGDETVFELASGDKNIFKALKGVTALSDCIIRSPYDNLDVIASSSLMSGIEFELYPRIQREFILKKLLKPIKESGNYDYILIDAPPTLGTWVVNILAASDYLIIPVEASPWGLFGLGNMYEFINEISEIAPDLEILGILVTKVSERRNYFKQTMETLKESGNRVFESYVRTDVNIEKAQDESKPVMVFSPRSRSSMEFYNLAAEVDKLCQ